MNKDTDKTTPPEKDTPAPPSTDEGDYMSVMSSLPYHATREALYKNSFQKVDESPWPTALLSKKGTQGLAQLKPLIADAQLFLSPEELEHWTSLMWRQREELSDTDADVLDSLSALWLIQANSPNDDAITEVDDLLAMRGLQPKTGGEGRKGGYWPEQRAGVLKALWHIQNLWINLTKVEVYEETSKKSKKRTPTTRAIQSRAFIITDRMGQLRLDGSMDVQRFIFRPGKVFAHFLFGPGRQTALLAARALQYDPYRQKWEKRLARYLSWQWRAQAKSGHYLRPYRVETLTEAVGEGINQRYPSRMKDRLEKALDVLQSDELIAAWQYDGWDESVMNKRRWARQWLTATVLIEPPDNVKEHYQRLVDRYPLGKRAPLLDNVSLHEQIKHRRKELGVSQMLAAEQLGVSQGHYSRLERGKATVGSLNAPLRRRLKEWLISEA